MNFLMTNDRELWTFKLPGGGNSHGEMAAAASPIPGSGGSSSCSRTLKRRPPVFSLPPALPQTPVPLIVAANLGGYFHAPLRNIHNNAIYANPLLKHSLFAFFASWRFSLSFVFTHRHTTRSRAVAEESLRQFSQFLTGKFPSAFRRHLRQLTGGKHRHSLHNTPLRSVLIGLRFNRLK